jgi:hypothetical protein
MNILMGIGTNPIPITKTTLVPTPMEAVIMTNTDIKTPESA